jgi:hypothetical protein
MGVFYNFKVQPNLLILHPVYLIRSRNVITL